jgi:nitrogen fixation protein FixH
MIKFNWGTGLMLFFTIFVVSMLSLVFATCGHAPNLVAKNYYDLDLNYQAHLVQKQNAAKLDTLPQIQFKAHQQVVSIDFPSGITVDKATAKFFRSATSDEDFSVDYSNTTPMVVPIEHLLPGNWHIELTWTSGADDYFQETTVFIHH